MSGKGLGSGAGSSRTHEKGSAGPSSRKRGGASADKEHKRLKRSKVTSFLILAYINCRGFKFRISMTSKAMGHAKIWVKQQIMVMLNIPAYMFR
jgi:hypothetical protein